MKTQRAAGRLAGIAVSLAVALVVSLAGAARGDAADGIEATPPGFTALFNGKDLAGWHGMSTEDPRKMWALGEAERAAARAKTLDDIRAHWKAENGELVNDGHGLYLTTDKDYGDIELLIDYKTVAGADSGIYLRANPQVQIWDTTEAGGKWGIGAKLGSGGLWNNSKGAPGKDPLVHADRPFGEWNRFRIVQVTDRTWIWLNGRLVVDGAVMENYFDRGKPLWPAGPIQLQTHGGEIRWRNVFVREIPAAEKRQWLGELRPLFDGKDFTGWEGATQNYEIVDGAIQCKKGTGGNLFTKEVFGDFVIKLEFRLPPGGNNGLLIRYPGTGDGAYSGMCELQVLDNDAPQYKTLDPSQYHGSMYGMVAAKRGFLRPTGEWNEQRVVVIGSTIKVELNGTIITEGDVRKVEKFLSGSRAKHTGIDNETGRFGFAGHGDPVAFRKIEVLRLD